MGYCTVDEVRKIPAFRAFTSGGGFRDEEITPYIDRATNMINSYLRERVPGIPFAVGSIPPEINDVCIRITICLAIQELKTVHGEDDSGMYAIELYCKDAYRYLTDLSKGQAVIEVDEEDEEYDTQRFFNAGDTSFLTDEL